MRAQCPQILLFVSASTLAGRAAAIQKLGGLADGVFYAPIDYVSAVRRVLRRLRPLCVVVLETEIWPNLYRETKRSGARLIIVNGRISNRTFPSYLRMRWFFRAVLQWPDVVLAQSDTDAQRYLQLGVTSDKVRVEGNLKYDVLPPETPVAIADFVQRWRPRFLWIAASTMPPAYSGDVDEDDVVIRCYQQLAVQYPTLLLTIAPRKPERFDVVAEKLRQSGVQFIRRSELEPETPAPLLPVLLLDSIGELNGLFPLADVVFMGGTLADRGGHNILEPAAAGRAIITGPHQENFASIAREFADAKALVEIDGADGLEDAVKQLLGNSDLRAHLGSLAREVAQSKTGATARASAEILDQYFHSMPLSPRGRPADLLMAGLSEVWKRGARWKRKRDLAARKALSTPVISVGGIAMGGVGKTPFVRFLANRLEGRGHAPGILMRGYRRRSPEKSVVLAPCAQVSTTLTGDEAQLFLRSGAGPVGIGADRYTTGLALEHHFHPDVILLDDGFQHPRLHRQLDIVLIDGLDPFGGNGVFPLGRLREPLEELSRADVFVITRSETGRMDGIERRLRRYNGHAPIYRARTIATRWRAVLSGKEWKPHELPYRRVAAFCGLANPAAFWNTLAHYQLEIIFRWSFGDHHVYKPLELYRLSKLAQSYGAEALVTTAKDVINLPAAVEMAGQLDLCCLEIEFELENETELLEFIEARLWDPEEAVSR